MSDDEKSLEQRLRDLQTHVDRVQEAQKEIESELSDLDHQSRRINDRVERGQRTADLDRERARVDEGRLANQRDLQANEDQLETLRREREELERRLRDLKAGSTGQ